VALLGSHTGPVQSPDRGLGHVGPDEGRADTEDPAHGHPGLNLTFVLSTMASSVWLMVRFFPNSREMLTVRSLAGNDAVGWIFSEAPGIPLALVSIQIAFWVGVKLLWDAAVHRLDGWEDS